MAEQEMCPNCKREIPQQNYRMHTLHCARNIALCPDCEEPIPRHELEQHRNDVHAMAECSLCGQKVEACKMDNHKTGDCPKKSLLCKFCATHVDQGNLQEHEDYCGSRTEKCEECKEFIMLKNWELHINSNHGFIKLNDEPGPKPSWEQKPQPKTTSQSTSSSYISKYSKYTDPSPSTASERAGYTATELFNNQDIYSSRRYSSSNTASSLLRSSSSSVVTSSYLSKSSNNSIVSKALNGVLTEKSTNGVMSSKSSSSVVSSMRRGEEDTSNGVTGAEDSDTKLPCEFCERMIPMYKLLSHQAECVNPTNVRERSSSAYNGGASARNLTSSSSSSVYRAYSSLRDSQPSENSGQSSSSSVSRSSSMKTETSTTNGYTRPSVVSKYLDKSSGNKDAGSRYSTAETNGKSPPRSIVGRYTTNPKAETPPHVENGYSSATNGTTSSYYLGRPSYLRDEEALSAASKKPASSSETSGGGSSAYKPIAAKTESYAPGMYENDTDREGLRQMLSSLRRDPMDVEDDPDNNDGSFFPCEFCGDPYPSEFIMRHQMSCDLNPCPISSGNGFDYSQIQKSIARNLGLEMPVVRSSAAYDAPSAEEVRSTMRTLSRSNSVVADRSYARSTRASSVSRTSSFADRSYGTRSSLARQCSFSIADYSSAARRSSVFDGYAGYSIYSSISEGLDQITYGGRMSRRNSVTDLTYSYSSRRGSFSASNGPDYPLPALMAALDASKASQDDRKDRGGSSSTAAANAHVNGQAHAFLNGNQYNGYSRQNSSQDNTHTIDSPFGAVNGYIERSDSKGLVRRRSSIKHSQSAYKLERKVSFHNHDQIIDNGHQQVDENGQPITEKPDKPKRKKERTEEEKAARRERKERKERKRMERAMSKERRHKDKEEARNKQHPVGGELVEQVSAKLQNFEREQQLEQHQPHTSAGSKSVANDSSLLLPNLPTTSLLPGFDQQASSYSPQHNNNYLHNQHSGVNSSSTTNTTTTTSHANNTYNSHEQSASSFSVQGTDSLDDNTLTSAGRNQQQVPADEEMAVTMRSDEVKPIKAGSKRNSLDNKSVQSLAKDLAAECAKAYELMESSLSKLTNDFSIGPFGLTPKNKKKYRAPPAPPLK